MEITARLTGDAQVATLKEGRTVVNFTVAYNDYYKSKGSSEGKQVTEFIRCSYWLSSGIAQYLTKGKLVELSGRVGVNAYISKDGEARANLTFHVNGIKLHGKGTVATAEPVTGQPVASVEDDLPF